MSACVFISAGGVVYFCFILGVFSGRKGKGLQVVSGEYMVLVWLQTAARVFSRRVCGYGGM